MCVRYFSEKDVTDTTLVSSNINQGLTNTTIKDTNKVRQVSTVRDGAIYLITCYLRYSERSRRTSCRKGSSDKPKGRVYRTYARSRRGLEPRPLQGKPLGKGPVAPAPRRQTPVLLGSPSVLSAREVTLFNGPTSRKRKMVPFTSDPGTPLGRPETTTGAGGGGGLTSRSNPSVFVRWVLLVLWRSHLKGLKGPFIQSENGFFSDRTSQRPRVLRSYTVTDSGSREVFFSVSAPDRALGAPDADPVH